jgi:hypothetical protein
MRCIRLQGLFLSVVAVGLVLALAAAAIVPARAEEAVRALTVSHLEAGTLAEGEAALAEIVASDATNADAQLGLGVIRFMRAIEHLSQGLYTHGLKPPQSFMAPSSGCPFPRTPPPKQSPTRTSAG